MRATDAGAGSGFTIIEVAVALFLLSLLFGSVFIPLRSQVDRRQVEETGRLLEKAREALIGYALSRGHFPCPADASSAGQEPAGTDHAAGTCPTHYGYLPAAALGFQPTDPQGYAVDAWGTAANRLRYAVSDQAAGPAGNTRAFTRVNGMRAAGIAALGDPALALLHVCASGTGVVAGASCGKAPTVVSTAPVVIWSSGPNAPTGGAGVDEAQNPNRNGGSEDRVFVMRVRSMAAGNEFDDIVTWVPMTRLIGALVAAGQLP